MFRVAIHDLLMNAQTLKDENDLNILFVLNKTYRGINCLIPVHRLTQMLICD